MLQAADRHAVRLTRDALRQVRGGHPWVYDGSLTKAPDGGAPGDLAVVFDDNRRFAAIGLLDPTSPLRIRILHVGPPRQLDDDFLIERLGAALDRRAPLLAPDRPAGPVTGWRVVHGENDQLGGLVIDRYDATLVVRLDTAAWEPHLTQVLDLLIAELDRRDLATTGVVVRTSRLVGAEPRVERGEVPEEIEFVENGLRFVADPRQGQKTGHFLDQRDNRALVGSLAENLDVLDVFCCTGGFAVHAAAGGAASVVAVDQSGPALAAVQRHLSLNGLELEAETREGDAFEVMERLIAQGRTFGLVIVDPPSFAAKAADRAGALRAYGRLAKLAATLTAQGGRLLQASCSSRIDGDELAAIVLAGVREAGRSGRIVERTGHALDHPVGFVHGAYLDAVLVELD